MHSSGAVSAASSSAQAGQGGPGGGGGQGHGSLQGLRTKANKKKQRASSRNMSTGDLK